MIVDNRKRSFDFRFRLSIISLFFSNKKSVVGALDAAFSWSIVAPEQQKQQLNAAVSAILTALNLPETEREQARLAYVVAADLALRQIEIEYNLPFFRQRMIEGVPFDAVALRDKKVLCAEILFLPAPEIPAERLEIIFKKADYVNQRIGSLRAGSSARLLLVIVTQSWRDETVKFNQTLRKLLHSHAPVETDARFFDFDNLQRNFLSES